MRKMRMMNKVKITNATGKKKFGTNFPGFKMRTGIVPVRNPTGQISVKIKPIRYEVTNTRLMRRMYFVYRKYFSALWVPSFRASGVFFTFLATRPVPRCKSPMGQAQAHTARPVKTPRNPMMRRGNKNNLQVKLPLSTLCSNDRNGQAEVAAGHAWQ
jgi:hypothetical protein